MTEHRRGRALAAVVLALAVVAGIAWWLTRDSEAEPRPVRAVEPTPVVSSTHTPRPDPCARPVERPFVPRTISVEDVARRSTVLALPRDAAGVVGVPPVSEKDLFAWDRGGVRPGDRAGRVLLNAHTWPDGSAVGNHLLRELVEGDRLVLRGSGGATACFEVFRRAEVREEDGYPGWNRSDGPHQAVIVVCSGERVGPGRWTHRTLWFARPIG